VTAQQPAKQGAKARIHEVEMTNGSYRPPYGRFFLFQEQGTPITYEYRIMVVGRFEAIAPHIKIMLLKC